MEPKSILADAHGRQIHKLRVQLTDACNFRCFYCMPVTPRFLPSSALLSSDELLEICSALVDFGIDEIRVSGGEPTLRKDFEAIIEGLSSLPLIRLGLTTNGFLLEEKLGFLKQTRYQHINISLDSLRAKRFYEITKTGYFQKVYDAVLQAKAEGFKVKEAPFVLEFKSKERPILEVSVSGGDSELTRRQFAELLEDLLLDVPGVAAVRRIGWREREFHVEVAPRGFRNITFPSTKSLKALAERNVTLPAGQIRTSHLEYNVRVTGEFDTVRQIEDVVIRANDAGNWLKIKDVARVVDTFEDETRIAKVDKKRAAAMVVVKSEKSDVVRVADRVKGGHPGVPKDASRRDGSGRHQRFLLLRETASGGIEKQRHPRVYPGCRHALLFMQFVPAVVTALGIRFSRTTS